MVEDDKGTSARDYGFLMFLTLLNVMNFVDRQLLASFANWIVPDLGLTNTQFGLLTGLIFIFFYSVAGVFMGVLADRVNRTRLIAAGLALWSALTALSGMAKGFVSLAIPRLFIGVGESIMTPTAMSLLADRFPSSRLGFASGVYYMGVPIGVAMSLFVVAYLEPLLGWRGCFYALGGLGLVLAAIMFFMKETPRRHEVEAQKRQAETEAAAIERPSVKEMLAILVAAFKRSPALLMTVLGGVAFHFVLGAATFEQLWFVQERGTQWLVGFCWWHCRQSLWRRWWRYVFAQNGHGPTDVLVLDHADFDPNFTVLPGGGTDFYVLPIWNFYWLLSARLLLRPNVCNGARTGAASDSRYGGCVLYSVVELFWPGTGRYRRRNFCGLDDRREHCRTVYGDLAGVYGIVVNRHSTVLFCWAPVRARPGGVIQRNGLRPCSHDKILRGEKFCLANQQTNHRCRLVA
jgi:MFS family permease